MVPFCVALDTETDSESEKEEPNTTSSESLQCDCQGCVDLHSPYQLSEVSESKTTHSHFSKERQRGQLKSYTRKLQPSWYKKYPWITVCSSRHKIFCVICRSAKQQGLLRFSKHFHLREQPCLKL